jgi:hypothetical protein
MVVEDGGWDRGAGYIFAILTVTRDTLGCAKCQTQG